MPETQAEYNPRQPVLWGPDGKAISTEGMLLAPHALSFASVIQLPGRLHSFRWDEALKDNPQNALAMRRDCFYRALMQERTATTINLDWQVVPEEEDDPFQKLRAAAMNRNWTATPDRVGLITSASEAIWYGRAGSQFVWGDQPNGMRGVTFHEPVNGDGIQFTWDNVPTVLVSYQAAQRIRALDPAAVVPATDRGAWGIRLYKPEYRRRFLIHKHVREAADYFEGEMSGGVHGVGMRSWVYWSGWLRTEVLSWMISFMQSTGMMDLVIFYYEDGNSAARTQAETNAKNLTGKMALVCPWRRDMGPFKAVEQVPMNTAGVQTLRDLIEGWCERHIERLFVGQSMSAGGGGPGGLEGDGRAEFAADTKYQLQKTDAKRIAETLTRDWLTPAFAFNFPGERMRLRVEPVLTDPDSDRKAQSIFLAVDKGVEVELADIRKVLGLREPREGKPTLGGKPAAPPAGPGTVGPGGNPNQPPGGPPKPVARPAEAGPDSVQADFFHRLGRLEQLVLYRASAPPWPGAVFDEGKHRWVNPDGSEPAQQAGRATGNAAPDDGGEALAARSKSFAARIKTFGGKAVEVAKAVGAKAHELSYRALALALEKGIDPKDIWEHADETKIINDRVMMGAAAEHLGIAPTGPVLNAVSSVLAYGVVKIKQFLRARAAEKGAAADKPTGYMLAPEFYDAPPDSHTSLVELWTELLRGLFEQMGLDPEQATPSLVSNWLNSGSDLAQEG